MPSDATRPLNPRDPEVGAETRGLLWPGSAHAWECSHCGLIYSSPAKHAEYNQQCADAARQALARAPYERADGRVVHLGGEVPAPTSEVLQFDSLDRAPMRPMQCSTCAAVVDMGGMATHAAWHRELQALAAAVNRLSRVY